MIGTVAFHIAGRDFWEFLFFLGLISVNLAVVNFLPIPVLDGGHMVFLIYEKIRGKQAPESVRVAATYAGPVDPGVADDLRDVPGHQTLLLPVGISLKD